MRMNSILALVLALGCASSPPPPPPVAKPSAPATSAADAPPSATAQTSDGTSAGGRPEVGAVAMVFKGDLGLTLWMLRIGKPEDAEVLLKYSGVDHPWSGQVMKAKKVNAGTGFDYRIKQDSGDYTTVVERAASWGGGHFFEAYLPGSKSNGDRVAYDEKASKEVSPQAFLTEYLNQKK